MVTADVDVFFESHGPIYYHGHWLTYGIIGDEWEVRCSACRDLVRDQIDVSKIDKSRLPTFWLYQLSKFQYECVEAEKFDSWKDIVLAEIEMATGTVADRQSKQRVEQQLSDIMVGNPSVDVTFDQP